jgi:hypothetical protein
VACLQFTCGSLESPPAPQSHSDQWRFFRCLGIPEEEVLHSVLEREVLFVLPSVLEFWITFPWKVKKHSELKNLNANWSSGENLHSILWHTLHRKSLMKRFLPFHIILSTLALYT